MIDEHILSIAREMVATEGKPRLGHLPGHYVAAYGELKPIPGAISKWVDGVSIVQVPLREPAPVCRKLKPVSIDALVGVDGHVDEAETHEVEELSATKPERIRVAGDETPEDCDEETERFEQVADAAVSEGVQSGNEGECDTEMQQEDSSVKHGGD